MNKVTEKLEKLMITSQRMRHVFLVDTTRPIRSENCFDVISFLERKKKFWFEGPNFFSISRLFLLSLGIGFPLIFIRSNRFINTFSPRQILTPVVSEKLSVSRYSGFNFAGAGEINLNFGKFVSNIFVLFLNLRDDV